MEVLYNILTWCGILGLFYLAAMVADDDDSRTRNSKVYRDLNETILNRNEEI